MQQTNQSMTGRAPLFENRHRWVARPSLSEARPVQHLCKLHDDLALHKPKRTPGATDAALSAVTAERKRRATHRPRRHQMLGVLLGSVAMLTIVRVRRQGGGLESRPI